jgi:hypothetical protein
MRERVQGCVTVGVAMVGAGALALAPMAPQPAQQMRADEIRTVNVSDMKLLAAPTSLLQALQIIATGDDPTGGLAGSGQRLVTSTLQGLLGPIALAQALGNDAATKAIIADYITAPLYIADPTIFALDDALPAPYGQDSAPNQFASTSDVFKFRQAAYALGQAVVKALGVQPTTGIGAAAIAPANPVGDPAFTAERLAQGFAESGQRLVESSLQGLLGPIALAQALGDDEAVKAIIANYIDGPLYVADPTIFAIDDVLPDPYGQDPAPDPRFGNTSDVLKFRANVLYTLREEIKSALGVQPTPSIVGRATELATNDVAPSPVGDPVLTATRLAQGLGESGQRFVTDTALGALGPIAAAQALVKGDNQGLYNVVESYVDAPLHIADPTIFAIDDVLPKPIGSDPETDPTKMNGSLVSQIRANVLIPARDSIKPGLKNVLGVPKPDPANKTVEKPVTELGADSSAATKTKTVPKHRATANNPVSSALKKLAKDVKKATTPPKHAKASAD